MEMIDPAAIDVRPAKRSDRQAIAEFLSRPAQGEGAADPIDSLLAAPMDRLVVAARGDQVVGACQMIVGAGRCAAVLAPRLMEWDTVLASHLIRVAAATVYVRHDTRLIQSLTEPEGTSPQAQALELAGFERLAVLLYLRRDIHPQEVDLPLPPEIEWLHYRRLRQGKFARTILQTYEDSLDCPKLSGIRTLEETIATHKHTGIFCPRAWNLAIRDGRPEGVCILNNLQGRGELVYLGVVPAGRKRGLGRVLVTRAIRDTAAMGLPLMGLACDLDNTPALHLYESMGFREIRRRLAYFVPAAALETLGT
jgi:GNAT superfamily N-acetyltransferase